ncbi:MAG: MobA/MobL family protein [Steroidobacteraceae bacterium]
MAKYFLLVKVISRGKGSRVTRAAAYRAGERIRDERTSESYNYSNRRDVVHKEILLPSRFAGRVDMRWARDRSTLWNAAEHAGRRRDARLAREVLVLLPPELAPAQRTDLVRRFSQELAEKYRGAVDLAVHEPRAGSDERHHHAHMLMTTREVTPEGLGSRTALELSGTERHARGLGPSKNDLLWIRERWAQVTNVALRDAGLAARIDHRSYKDQGIDREPTPTIPQKVYYAERRSGVSTPAGDDIRARYGERVEARLKGQRELARVLQRQKEANRQRAIAHSAQQETSSKQLRHGMLTRTELNQKRREYYTANAEEVNRKRRARAAQVAANRLLALQERRSAGTEVARETASAERNAASIERLSPSEVAEQAARNWQAYRESQKEGPTAEESARKWAALRESRKLGPTAEESVRNWVAFREAQKAAESTRTYSQERVNEKEAESDRKKEGKSADYGLE